MNSADRKGPVRANDANLAGSEFVNVNLAASRFDNVNLQRAVISNVNLSAATFHDVNLTNARITAANTTGMRINEVDVSALVHACGHPGRFDEWMPVLRVEDMQRAVDWYTSVIGFELLWRNPNESDGENCMLREGPLTLMLSTGTHLGGKPVFTGTLYFNLRDVGAFHDAIRQKVEFVWPLEQTDYGTLEFGIRDPDGYVLAFAQRL